MWQQKEVKMVEGYIHWLNPLEKGRDIKVYTPVIEVEENPLKTLVYEESVYYAKVRVTGDYVEGVKHSQGHQKKVLLAQKVHILEVLSAYDVLREGILYAEKQISNLKPIDYMTGIKVISPEIDLKKYLSQKKIVRFLLQKAVINELADRGCYNTNGSTLAISTASCTWNFNDDVAGMAIGLGGRSVMLSNSVYGVAIAADSYSVSKGSIAITLERQSLAYCEGYTCGGIAIAAGDDSKAVSRNENSVSFCCGDDGLAEVYYSTSIAISVGRNGKAKGPKGSFLVLAEWGETYDTDEIIGCQTVYVDGIFIKENTYYQLKEGKIVEVNKKE